MNDTLERPILLLMLSIHGSLCGITLADPLCLQDTAFRRKQLEDFESSLTLLSNKTGAYVSGRKMMMKTVHTPANIIITQNIHRQLSELAAILEMNISKKETFCWEGTYYPLTIGPRTGPIKVAAVKTLVAGPRPPADHISAITPALNQYKVKGFNDMAVPPQFVRGATAKKPERNRVIKRVSMLGARA